LHAYERETKKPVAVAEDQQKKQSQHCALDSCGENHDGSTSLRINVMRDLKSAQRLRKALKNSEKLEMVHGQQLDDSMLKPKQKQKQHKETAPSRGGDVEYDSSWSAAPTPKCAVPMRSSSTFGRGARGGGVSRSMSAVNAAAVATAKFGRQQCENESGDHVLEESSRMVGFASSNLDCRRKDTTVKGIRFIDLDHRLNVYYTVDVSVSSIVV